MRQKSPQVVKHVVKCEKWACSTPKAGKNKPIIFVAKSALAAAHKGVEKQIEMWYNGHKGK
jgi:hypothetical protein